MKKKKMIYIITAILTMCASNLYAYEGGNGSADSPYLVATAQDLQNIKDEPTACYRLVENIDLTDFAWSTFDFSGTLDGDGHEISYLTIPAGGNGVGLFGNFDRPGVIRNLTLRNFDIVCGNWAGCLVSTSGNWEDKKSGGTIENCRAIDCNISGGECIGIFVFRRSFRNRHQLRNIRPNLIGTEINDRQMIVIVVGKTDSEQIGIQCHKPIDMERETGKHPLVVNEDDD